MESSKKVVCRSTFSVILLIIILPLVNFAVFQIHQLKAVDIYLQEDVEKQPLEFLLGRLVRGQQSKQFQLTGFVCLSEQESDMYVSSNEVRFDTRSSKAYIPSNQKLQKYIVQPYALKTDETAMKLVKPVEIQHGNMNPPACNYIHDAPAIIFSSGGFVGNIYHEFNDVIIPLFLTSRHFRSQAKLLVTDFNLEFINKYKKVFRELSRYEVIDGAETGNGSVHCFPGAVLGLKHHGILALNESDIPVGHSIPEFRDFLRKSFGLKTNQVPRLLHGTQSEKPRLLLLPRAKTRTILNQADVVKTIADLGFRVVIPKISEISNLEEFAHVINSCRVMLGVHGAGLTNELFLPDGAVMIQVVGINLDWAGKTYYGAPAESMGLHYLEYKIDPRESSLYDLYGPYHPVVVDPKSIEAKGYAVSRVEYLEKQNVRINLHSFRKTLVRAMRLLQRPTN